MTTKYKNLLIITSKSGRDYVWSISGITEDNGDQYGDAESAEEFRTESEAIEDAKTYIDEYVK